MKIKVEKKSRQINTVDDWKRYAPPMEVNKQWKKGRSAFCLASFVLSDKFGAKIQELIESLGLSCPAEFVCEPEAQTSFPVESMGERGPRNHDLLMVSDDLLIGIEAKVSESFADTIKDWKEKGRQNKDGGKNRTKRLEGFCDILYGNNRPDNLNELRYQLFAATVGTILEAKERGIKKCMMLVLVFEGNVARESDYDNNVKKNDEDFGNFCNSLNLPNDGGKITRGELQCWVKKITVSVD